MQRRILLAVLACQAALFLACSRTEPKIVYGSIRLVYSEEAGRQRERLSFFVLPEDDDGVENLAELNLYHDQEGLAWHFSPEDWVSYEVEEKTWVGSHDIAMAGDEGLPRGLFRAVLVNKGGEKSERTFSYDAPEGSRYPFPSFSVENGRFRVESAYPEHRLICYDAEGNFLSIQPVFLLDGTLEDLKLPDNVRGAALWAEDDEYAAAALTSVVSLR